MHLEEFPVSHLCLLPLSTRRNLLWRLPVADVCLLLENTDFTTGLNMESFWTSTWKDGGVDVAGSSYDPDVKAYFQAWDRVEYARAMLYGLMTTMSLGYLRDGDFVFYSPHYGQDCTGYRENWGMPVYPFLYAVRRPFSDNPVSAGRLSSCDLICPTRYAEKSTKYDGDLTGYEVVNMFGHDDELPRIIPELTYSGQIHLDLEWVYFLQNAVYLAIDGSPFEEQGLKFLKAVLEEAINLEVLILDHWGEEGEREVKFFDEFCALLSSCPEFLSHFQLLKIFSSIRSNGFVVSRENFNQLITAYFAAPTDHVQKLHITRTKIKCSDLSFECSPMIEQRYRCFKTIQMRDCQFVSKYKATPKVLSHWLGIDLSISELPQSEPDTCFFKVMEDDRGLSRKRKYSDLKEQA